MAEASRLSQVAPKELFNSPFAEEPVIIDGRPEADFRAGSIKYSYNWPATSPLTTRDLLQSIRNIGYHDVMQTIFFLDVDYEKLEGARKLELLCMSAAHDHPSRPVSCRVFPLGLGKT